ncbi:MAG TPA: TIGR03790 family protein, partial [Pontiellaceae bacterium]|nr:TIGR03790 family protein [Pontiellaceae bacterium]
MRKKSVFSLITVLLAVAVQAQMPHRVAVLVNENSQNSKKAANVFAALHGVPGGNLIYLNLPESIVKGRAECTPEEFAQYIYDPAQKIIGERGLTNQVLAWVYSVDFPIRIVTSPNDRQQMSLIGLTFSRGKVPALEMVEKGQFISPLFAGPVNEGGPKNGTQSFDILSANLKEKMPLPSMMLGYTGENGTDMDTVLRCLQNGILARQSGFKTPVLLVQTDDKARSGPREWQYADVKTELAQRGGSAEIYTNQPPARTNLLGVLTGAENVKPADFGTFAPGAFCEHLTSWSAEFQKPQTKCTEWLKAGATVTAGMVTEPYANWLKFPHARFFVHYASGCSAMESFYQSIASPMQVLLLGDPLSQVAGIPV